MEKLTYYDNKEERGIIYDWKKIRKLYNTLDVPDEFYYPAFHAVVNGNRYIQSLSIRSTGKTTSWILVGLCMKKLYGTVIQYLRTTEDELTPSHMSKLIEPIRTYRHGFYIEKLTDGEYNDIYYYSRQFFYCHRNEEGIIDKKAYDPIIQTLVVSLQEDYKSTYNTYEGKGDLIIYDEFIKTYYTPNSFFNLMNLNSTIARGRKSCVCIMCANTTNVNSTWFAEFGISKQIQGLKAGENRSIVTPKGTKLYIEYFKIENEKAKQNREEINRLYFGFSNPKLSSITGESDWAFDYYPHIPVESEDDNLRILLPNLYIDHNVDLLRVKICKDRIRGVHARVHKATKTYDDSIIASIDLEKIKVSPNHYFAFSYSQKLRKVINKLLEDKKFYFGTNEDGALFYDFINQIKKARL